MKVAGQTAPPPERNAAQAPSRRPERDEGWDRALENETQREVEPEVEPEADDEDGQPAAQTEEERPEDTPPNTDQELPPSLAEPPMPVAQQDLAWLGLLGAAFVLPTPPAESTAPLQTSDLPDLTDAIVPGEGLQDLAASTWPMPELGLEEGAPAEATVSATAAAPHLVTPDEPMTASASPTPSSAPAAPTRPAEVAALPEPQAVSTPVEEAIELEVGELGRVRLHVEVADDGLKLEIHTEDPRTAAFLQARKTELLDAVQATAKGASVDVNVTAEEQHRRSGREDPAPKGDTSHERSAKTGSTDRPTPRYVGVPGLVNEVA